MNKDYIFWISAILLSTFLISCRHDKLDISPYSDVCFENEIKPIFISNCAISGCHNSETAEAGFIFENYSGVMEGISAGDPLNSEVYKVITSEWINMMPPEKPLNQEQRVKIRLWIEQGAKQDSCFIEN